jgi:hypothetical protein
MRQHAAVARQRPFLTSSASSIDTLAFMLAGRVCPANFVNAQVWPIHACTPLEELLTKPDLVKFPITKFYLVPVQ